MAMIKMMGPQKVNTKPLLQISSSGMTTTKLCLNMDIRMNRRVQLHCK